MLSIILASLLFLPIGATNQEPSSQEISIQDFELIVQRFEPSLDRAAAKRPFAIEGANNALESVVKAVKGLWLLEEQPFLNLLRTADESYPQSRFSEYLRGIYYFKQGKYQKAALAFEAYLKHSQKYTSFDEVFLRWRDYHVIRKSAFDFLMSHSSLDEKQHSRYAMMPVQSLIDYFKEPSRPDWAMNVLFLVIILGGGLLLILSNLFMVDFSERPMSHFFTLYICVWFLYVIWIYDILMGLPFKWERSPVMLNALGVITFLIILSEIIANIAERFKPLEAGYKRCPYCHEPTLELSIICEKCGKEL